MAICARESVNDTPPGRQNALNEFIIFNPSWLYTTVDIGASLVPLPYFLTASFVAFSSSLNHLTSLELIKLETRSACVFLNLNPKPSCE